MSETHLQSPTYLEKKHASFIAEQYSKDYLRAHLHYLKRKTELLRRKRLFDDEALRYEQKISKTQQQRLEMISLSASDMVKLKYIASREVFTAERELQNLCMALKDDELEHWKQQVTTTPRFSADAELAALERKSNKKCKAYRLKIEEREQEIEDMETLLARFQRQNSKLANERDEMGKQIALQNDALDENKKIKKELMQLKRAEEKRLEKEEKEQMGKRRREEEGQKRREEKEREERERLEREEEEEEKRKRAEEEQAMQKKNKKDKKKRKRERDDDEVEEEEEATLTDTMSNVKAMRSKKDTDDGNSKRQGKSSKKKKIKNATPSVNEEEREEHSFDHVGPKSYFISDSDEWNTLHAYTKNIGLKSKQTDAAASRKRKRKLNRPQTDIDECWNDDDNLAKRGSNDQFLSRPGASPSIRSEHIPETTKALRDTTSTSSTSKSLKGRAGFKFLAASLNQRVNAKSKKGPNNE